MHECPYYEAWREWEEPLNTAECHHYDWRRELCSLTGVVEGGCPWAGYPPELSHGAVA